LTVCLASLGRHVDGLAFFDVLFGAAPPLSPPQKFYLRMLANDPAEAAAEAEVYLKDHSLQEYYDDVAMQGIGLATLDLRRGKLALERLPIIHETALELIDDLTANMEKERKKREAKNQDKQENNDDEEQADVKAAADVTPHSHHQSNDLDAYVLCVPGRNILDDSASVMLAQLLAERGITVTTDTNVSSPASSQSRPALICISYFGAKFSPTHARFLIRRMRRQYPGVPVLAGYWAVDPDGGEKSASAAAEADFAAINLAEAVDVCVSSLTSAQAAGTKASAKAAL
jgi:hypothetical protein